jgi:stress response protein YsnF
MLSEREVSAAIGGTAYGANGDKLGTVEHFFVDDRTGEPTWVSVTTGLFGTRRSVVPVVDATFDEGALRLPVTADAVKNAPGLAGEDHLDPAEEAELRRHYGPESAGPETGTTAADVAAMDAPTQEMAVVPPHPSADGEAGPVATDGGMVRSEERLRVGTERVATTRARLVKYVVTEEVQITVPIRREEIRVEEVPLDAPDTGPGESLADDQGRSGAYVPPGDAGSTGGLPEEIVLHAERPVVSVEVVPVERVRLRTETVRGQERVTEQVQREQIVVDQTPSPQLRPR